KINNWVGNQIPPNVLMNVRVRTRINNVNGNWGPACRMMIDPVRAACPLTKLMDVPGNAQFSCNVTRPFATGQYVWARPVTGANKYQFRFRIDAENFVTIRTATTYFVQLNWNVQPLQDGKTYQVEVRASKDNGVTWCIDTPTPAPGPNYTPWGDACDLTIDNTPVNGGGQNMVLENGGLRMYPNPNRGDQLYLSLELPRDVVVGEPALSGVEGPNHTIRVDIYDLYGERVSAHSIPANDGFINTVLDLPGDMASGVYLVNITAGEQRFTERLVIEASPH
ncbi:MAG TPA: T9SS type A sorting domain-containing protein, partial [Flavobacteriales bacterium]|nr:T9SS type A sorting domain-containing protein [Flavobacteriales bacterium]